MKLVEIESGMMLGEHGEELLRATRTNLIMFISTEDEGVSNFEGQVIVISDVPLINREKYKRLYQLSFPEGNTGPYDIIYPVHLDDSGPLGSGIFRRSRMKWVKWVISYFPYGTETWKEFIESVQRPAGDDFSE